MNKNIWDMLAFGPDAQAAQQNQMLPNSPLMMRTEPQQPVLKPMHQPFNPPSMKQPTGYTIETRTKSVPKAPADVVDYESQITDLYKKSLDDQVADKNRYQEELNSLEKPGGFESLNLAPAMALYDSWTGTNLAQSYKPPTAEKDYEAKKMLLQNALTSSGQKITGDQLDYLKMKSAERKGDEASELRKLMYQTNSQNKAEKSESDYEMRLRKEYMSNPLYKQMGEINQAYAGIQANPATDGPSQQALVYQYSKMLDPGSVVRETEYAMSAANAGKIAQAQNFFNKMKTGEMLRPDQVKLMKEVAKGLADSARSSLNKHNEYYSGVAKRKGIDPSMVISDSFYNDKSSGPKVGDVVDGMKFLGGDPSKPTSWGN